MSGLTGVKMYHRIEGVEAAIRDVFETDLRRCSGRRPSEFSEEGDDVVVEIRMYGWLKGSSQEIEDKSPTATYRPSATVRRFESQSL